MRAYRRPDNFFGIRHCSGSYRDYLRGSKASPDPKDMALLEAMRANSLISVRDLARRTGMNWTTAECRVRLLEKAGFSGSRYVRQQRRYFLTSQGLAAISGS